MTNINHARWIVGFYVRKEGRSRFYERFPAFESWHEDKKGAIAEGTRVLKELNNAGDTRDWVAFAQPDPIAVTSQYESQQGEQWFIRLRDLT